MSVDLPWQPTSESDREMVASVSYGSDLFLYARG
jgi:hypothetical protein